MWDWPCGHQPRPPESKDSRSASNAPRQQTQRRTGFLRGQSYVEEWSTGEAELSVQLLGEAVTIRVVQPHLEGLEPPQHRGRSALPHGPDLNALQVIGPRHAVGDVQPRRSPTLASVSNCESADVVMRHARFVLTLSEAGRGSTSPSSAGLPPGPTDRRPARLRSPPKQADHGRGLAGHRGDARSCSPGAATNSRQRSRAPRRGCSP